MNGSHLSADPSPHPPAGQDARSIRQLRHGSGSAIMPTITAARSLVRRLLVDKAESKLVQFLRYAVVSGVSLGVDFGLLYIGTEFVGLHYLASAIVSYSLGLVVNYLLSVLWAFPHSRFKSRALEFVIFVVIGVAGMGLNEVLLWFFTDIVMLHYLVSRSITAAFGYAWKFVLRKVVLFT
jgi:putative flippase GtrA